MVTEIFLVIPHFYHVVESITLPPKPGQVFVTASKKHAEQVILPACCKKALAIQNESPSSGLA